MPDHSIQLVQKLWNYCNVLRDDGLSYGDYVEQLTFLLFLKMADEQTRPPFNKPSAVPKEFGWPSLLARDGDELETHYRHVLESLGKQKGMLGGRPRSGAGAIRGHCRRHEQVSNQRQIQAHPPQRPQGLKLRFSAQKRAGRYGLPAFSSFRGRSTWSTGTGRR